MAKEPSPAESADRTPSPKSTENTNCNMIEREEKKRRLRELEDTHHYVKTIVSHMSHHYKDINPPPWLDLRAVAAQLMRSIQAGSNHAAWKCARESLVTIRHWKGDHESWKEAVQIAKMPYLGTPSEIMAAEFIDGKQPCIPRSLMRLLSHIELDFLLEDQPHSDETLPNFWKGSDISNPEWRGVYMKRRTWYTSRLPFDDDLTDLVLSAVCQKYNPKPKVTQQQSGQKGGKDDNYGLEPSVGDDSPRDVTVARKENIGESEGWKDKVQATMSRISSTVNETLAVEKVKLLGKRYRQENDTALPDVQEKRQRTAEEVQHPPKVITTVENTDDDRSSPSDTIQAACIAKEEERFRVLKANYKKLKRQDRQLATLFTTLDESTKELGKEIGQLTRQHKEVRKELDTGHSAHEQLVKKFDDLETQNKSLGDKAQQLAVQTAALTDDLSKLGDKSGQIAAQCSALEDENKILRAQMVSLMARVEALEQTQSASKPSAGPSPAAASDAPKIPNQAEEPGQRRPRQHSVIEEGSRDPIPRGHGLAVAASTMPSSQWQSAGVIKYENIDTSVVNQLPPSRYKRAVSRFPRVLDMPTFDQTWEPQQELFNRRAPEHNRAPRLTPYPESVNETVDLTTSQPCFDPAVRVPTPATTPVQTSAPAEIPAAASAQTTVAVPVQTPAPASAGASPFFRPPILPSIESLLSRPATPQPQPQSQLQSQQPPQTQHQPQPQPQLQPPTLAANANPNANPNARFESSFQTHLAWLPPAHRRHLLAFLNDLDRRVWAAPTDEIVARCRAGGLQYDRLRELVEGYGRVLRDLGVVGPVGEDGEARRGGVGEGEGEVGVMMVKREEGVSGES